MNKELKKNIIYWFMKNENVWQRVNTCHKTFRQYIYDNNGEYIIGGQEVSDFICAFDKIF